MDMVIPQSALKYILWQRTEYQKLYASPLVQRIERFSHLPLQHWMVPLEARLFPTRVKQTFARDMDGEFREIREWLPTQPHAILDVGCGIAGIDVLLYQHFQTPLTLYLLDKSTVDASIHYGFASSGSFYNSLTAAKQLLVQNGVPAAQIHLLEATSDNQIAITEPLDMIISLISWGFHYPVATYLEPAFQLLKPGGRLIIDVRQGTGEEQLLRDRFASVDLIATHPRSWRFAATK